MQTDLRNAYQRENDVAAQDYCGRGTNGKLLAGQTRWVDAYTRILANPVEIVTGKISTEDLIDREKVADSSRMIGEESFYKLIKAC